MTTYDLLCLTPVAFSAYSARHDAYAYGACIPMWLSKRFSGFPELLPEEEEEDQLFVDESLGTTFLSMPMRRGLGPLRKRDRTLHVTSLDSAVTRPQKARLIDAGIHYIGDCATRSEAEMLSIPGMTGRAVSAIREALSERGLTFKGCDSSLTE